MKKIICLLLCVIFASSFVSCGKKSKDNEIDEELYNWYWESYVDILQLTRDGKILRNFEMPHESVSRYSISDGKIRMYVEDAEDEAIVFDFRMEDDKLYIGELEYTKYQEITSTAEAENGEEN
ncbi:MAG: hypothetical protein IKU43_09560 [Clostridia bacterium]|nr:hypothetical protein [Clostridia bacterium]